MNAGKYAALLRWLFFTVILSLLQVWVLMGFRFFREEGLGLRQVLLDGGLIFFANSVAMDVLARRWDEFRVVRASNEVSLGRDSMFLYGVFLPCLVLVIAVVMYCALLSSKVPSSRIIWGELLLTLVALSSSLTHILDFSRRFRRQAGEEGGDAQEPRRV